MRDLHLWRLLQETTPDPSVLKSALTHISDLSLQERLPFLGLLLPLLQHPDADLRLLAIRAFAGATGRQAVIRLLQVVNDADDRCSREAIEILRNGIASKDWTQWIHLLFHPSADVRRRSIDPNAHFPPPALYKLYLLTDPECRSLVEEQINGAMLDHTGLPLLFDFLRRAIITTLQARKLASNLSWSEWLMYLSPLLPRNDDISDALGRAMSQTWPNDLSEHYLPDRLDDIFHLVWEPILGEEQGPTAHHHVFDQLFDALLIESEPFRQWIVFTLLGVIAQHKSVPELVAQICATFYPPFLLCEWIDLQVRKIGVTGFRRAGSHCPRQSPEVIKGIVQSNLCWKTTEDAERRLDFETLYCVLLAVQGNSLKYLLDWIDVAVLQKEFQHDFTGAVKLLSLPDNSSHSRSFLVRELSLLEGPDRYRLSAQIARAVPSDALDFLERIDAVTACRLVEELLRTESEPNEKPLSENKIRQLSILLAGKIAAGQVEMFLRIWLDSVDPEAAGLAHGILARLIHDHDTRLIQPALVALDPARLQRFLNVLPYCAGFPYDEEIELARRLSQHQEDAIRQWAQTRMDSHEELRGTTKQAKTREVHSSEPQLRLGLCAQLAAQESPPAPDVEVCQALLASHDSPEEVIFHLGHYLSAKSDFIAKLDIEMIKHWQGETRLPLLGHLWLHRWDNHKAILSNWLHYDSMVELPFGSKGMAGCLVWSQKMPVPLARRVWEACVNIQQHWRWHAPERLNDCWNGEMVDVLLQSVGGEHGDLVARMALYAREHLKDSRAVAALHVFRSRLIRRMPDLNPDLRKLYANWIDIRGLHGEPTSHPTSQTPVIITNRSIDQLVNDLLGADPAVSKQAAHQLLRLDEEGHDALIGVLNDFPQLTWPLDVLFELSAVPAIRSALLRLVSSTYAQPEVRFRAAMECMHSYGENIDWDTILAAICTPGSWNWFTEADYLVMCRDYPDCDDLHYRLILAPHPHAYGPSVHHLIEGSLPEERTIAALLDFLDLGTDRMREWRVQAAGWLYRHGERESVLPILLGETARAEPPYPELLKGVPGRLVQSVAQGTLLSGLGENNEVMLVEMLEHGRIGSFSRVISTPAGPGGYRGQYVDPLARQQALADILAGGCSIEGRKRARKALRSGMGRFHKLRRVGDTFAWGVRIGRQLTGKLFTLEMIAGEELGYTRLNENKLYISPMPILRGQQNAREVVRALILHEYGHHLYHKGDVAEGIWRQAEEEKLQRLLNLVSDEHLERNLRVKDSAFGDQLHTLASYAFQHTAREIGVETLLDTLRAQAFAVLSQTHLGVARQHGCVSINTGRILLQMEKVGMSFARFVRALRMGLGNRHNDPKVQQGLALFHKRFKDSDMPRLMEITHELRKIFGEETDLLNTFNQDRALLAEADDLADASEGITNEELQTIIQQTLEGQTEKRPREGGSGFGRGYNRDASENFDLITNVVPKAHDPVRHGKYAQQVARPADRMRRFLQELGLGFVQQRLRVQGRMFDRTRIRSLVTRRDPRVLIARQLEYQTDLFLGILIDCSGSMSSNENIEKAKLFGTLLAESARGLRGMDVRLWGFTDRTIYDCGSAVRPAVHDLEPEDGNNDAAALWHAAMAARASKRRAKMLVMISDGSPTGCSVGALQALVTQLTKKRNILCAQIAVRRLDDICFPHYVLLEDDRVDDCVRKFGHVMMKLVRQALRG